MTHQDDQYAIEDLLDASTRLLDKERWAEWLDLFDENATYAIISHDGVTESGGYVLDTHKDGVAARLRLLEDPSRIREKAGQSHVVAWGPVRGTETGQAQVESRFSLFETKNQDGVSRLAYVGYYADQLKKGPGRRWRIASRIVHLDSFTFKALLVPI